MSELNFDDLWSSVKNEPPQAQKKEWTVIPDGKYQVVIKHAQVDLTSERKHVAFQYKIKDEGAVNGRIFFVNFGLDDKGLPILKRELVKLGVNVEAIKKIGDLNDALLALIDRVCYVYAKKRTYIKKNGEQGTAYNVYVQGELVTDLKDTGFEPPATVGSDDFTF